MKVNQKGTVKQVGSVAEAAQERFLAWLRGEYKPHLRVVFKRKGKPVLVASGEGFHRNQLRVV